MALLSRHDDVEQSMRKTCRPRIRITDTARRLQFLKLQNRIQFGHAWLHILIFHSSTESEFQFHFSAQPPADDFSRCVVTREKLVPTEHTEAVPATLAAWFEEIITITF